MENMTDSLFSPIVHFLAFDMMRRHRMGLFTGTILEDYAKESMSK